jgi:hypothetical protein
MYKICEINGIKPKIAKNKEAFISIYIYIYTNKILKSMLILLAPHLRKLAHILAKIQSCHNDVRMYLVIPH